MSWQDDSTLSSVVWTSHKERTHQKLIQEIMTNHPNAPLSPSLRKTLESMNARARRKLVERKYNNSCAPLFMASKRGKLEIVMYLVHVCGADLEQLGSDVDNQEHQVTPFWSAAASGHLSVVRVLAAAGADLNAPADTGSTPMSAACENNNYDVVSFLVEKGADIDRPDRDGETCLMKSVYCVRLCSLLIERVSDVNVCDIYNQTALHFSVRAENTETMTLLLDNGADPFARSSEGDDALQLACLVGATPMVDLLIKKVHYLPERLADTYELLAAILLENHNNVEGALSKWREALALRSQFRLPKLPKMKQQQALRFAREFIFEAELDLMATNEEALHTQALLVFERVLSSQGSHHKVFSDQLMIRGVEYMNEFLDDRCIALWTWALEVRLRDSEFYPESEICVTAGELTRLFQDMHTADASSILFQDVFRVFSLLTDMLLVEQQGFKADEVYIHYYNYYKNGVFKVRTFIMQLLHLLLTLVEEGNETEDVRKIWADVLRDKLCSLVAHDMRIIKTVGETMLHFAVSELHFVQCLYFSNEQEIDDRFPSLRCARAILAAGASPNIRNYLGYSPLYVAAHEQDYNPEIVLELLKGGAHIDQPDCDGTTPAHILAENPASFVKHLQYRTLACLAASAIARYRIYVPPDEVPKALLSFVRLHQHELYK